MSETGAGTEVQLSVPAAVAYEASRESVGSKLFRKVWLAGLPGTPVGTATLFTGAFVGPINWTLVNQDGAKLTYTLSGDVTGVSNGESVTGTTVQNFYTSNGQLVQGIAHIVVGTSELTY